MYPSLARRAIVLGSLLYCSDARHSLNISPERLANKLARCPGRQSDIEAARRAAS